MSSKYMNDALRCDGCSNVFWRRLMVYMKLISTVAVESPLFDRKSAHIDAKTLAIHPIAFANADGGMIAVGMEDDGTITGIYSYTERINELLRAPFDFCKPSVLLSYAQRQLQRTFSRFLSTRFQKICAPAFAKAGAHCICEYYIFENSKHSRCPCTPETGKTSASVLRQIRSFSLFGKPQALNF